MTDVPKESTTPDEIGQLLEAARQKRNAGEALYHGQDATCMAAHVGAIADSLLALALLAEQALAAYDTGEDQ